MARIFRKEFGRNVENEAREESDEREESNKSDESAMRAKRAMRANVVGRKHLVERLSFFGEFMNFSFMKKIEIWLVGPVCMA